MPDLPKKQEINCPECQSRLSAELIHLLFEGKTIYCEKCGFPFVGIQDGQVKPLQKPNGQEIDSPNLTKEEEQWLKWKTQWADVKDMFKSEWKTQKMKFQKHKRAQHAMKRGFRRQQKQKSWDLSVGTLNTEEKVSPSHQQTVTEQSFNGFSATPPSSPESSALPPKISPSSKTPPSVPKGLGVWIDVLSRLSLLYYFIIYIFTFTLIATGAINGLQFSGNVVIGFLVFYLDMKYYLPQARRNNHSHAGIPLIFLGLFTLRVYGMGLILIARGVLILLKFIYETKLTNPNHPAVVPDPDESLWLREVLRGFKEILRPLILTYYIAGILFSIEYFASNYPRSVFYLVYSLLVGIAVLIIFEDQLRPWIHNKPVEALPREQTIFLIVIGAISLGSMIGVPMLIYGILTLVFQEKLKSHPHPLPVWDDMSLIKRHLVATKAPVHTTQNYPKGETPKPRFDPETGKPLSPQIARGPSVSQPPSIQLSPSPTDPASSSPASDAQIYTVLDPDIRARLLTLPISSADRGKVAKSFIYLNRDQQIFYLNELYEVNLVLTPKNSKIAQRIYKLPIPATQHNLLLKQLDYLPTPQQEEFITFLEATISTRS